MRLIKQTIAIVFSLFSTIILAQEPTDFSATLFSETLKENADAIIRYNKKTIEVLGVDKMIVKQKRVITVLNKLGKKHVNAYLHYNEDTKISKLNAAIYSSTGKRIEKYSKSDFQDVSAVDGGTLYSDSRVKYLEYTPTSYPYTVVLEWEYKNASTAFIPSWFPVESYNVSVEKSIYEIHNPLNISYRKREKNFDGYAIKNTTNETSISYGIANQPAIKYEERTISFNEFVPNLTIAFDVFALKGVKGTAKNWKEFGKWMYEKLLKGRAMLSPATVAKAKDLIKDINDSREKVKKIYEFVQSKTRYISVQVDIGGWEPISANKVDEVSYGDCKGLTNYTKALLDAVGIESHHVIIYAKNKRNIDKNFTSMQGNHMILNVPNNGEDIWLECTSQTTPFGFLGNFTDDRDVLVITPDGGVIKRTPKYNKNNQQDIKATITLNENGSVGASVKRTSYGVQYNDKYHIEGYTEKELNKYYKSYVWDYNNNLELSNIQLSNDKEAIEFTEDLFVNVNSYATVNETSYLFRVNLLNKTTNIPKRYRNRKRPLKIHQSFEDTDTYTIKLPKGFSTDLLPPKKEIKNKFGSYTVTFNKVDENTISYNRKFSLNEGVYPKEDYKPYRKFIKSVARYDNLRIELQKQ
ncbi:Transglutaminase-like superfamily protein [Tenacibaculum sp. 190524A02b]|uniref:DUF3857 domain-containing protein n=1 Tax=Tenacibaculum vairaonense TaxID=3137860 RepID=UPI0032B262EB